MAAALLSIERLRGALRGPVLAPDDWGYDGARATFNAMIDRRPAAIAWCAGIDDVVAAVDFAGRAGLPVAIRGGGHSVAGHAVCEGGLMIDLRLMHQVRVDSESRRRGSAAEQPGATSTRPASRIGSRSRAAPLTPPAWRG